MNCEKSTLARTWYNNGWLLRQIWKYHPVYLLMMILEGVLSGVNCAIGIFHTKEVFDVLYSQSDFAHMAEILMRFGIYLLLYFLFHCWFWQIYQPRAQERLHQSMSEDLFGQAMRLDLDRYTDPVFYNGALHATRDSNSHMDNFLGDMGKLISRTVSSVAVMGLLFGADVTMAFACLGVSLFRIWLSRRKTAKNEPKITVIGESVAIAAHYGLFLLMLYQFMVTGSVTLGSVAVTVNAIWLLSRLNQELADRLLCFQGHGQYAEDLIAFVQCESTMTDGTEEAGAFESLHIGDLTFAYPGRMGHGYALRRVDMVIHQGETIAVVGGERSGKSTLAQLMVRLYDPTEGYILYNGRNIKEYTRESLHRRVAAVSRDYRIFADTPDDGAADSTFYKEADLILLDEPSESTDDSGKYAFNRAFAACAAGKTVVLFARSLPTVCRADRIYLLDEGKVAEWGTHDQLMKRNGKYAALFREQTQK